MLRAAGAPTDRITLSVNALLVRMGHRVVLIDTGLGPKAHGALLESLHDAGVKPTAVTDVLITHSHGDHVGGLVDAEGHLAFPKATIRMSSPEWEFMQSKGSPDVAKVISKKVHPFEPGAEVLPGIKSVPLKGHTPGHTGYRDFLGKRASAVYRRYGAQLDRLAGEAAMGCAVRQRQRRREGHAR